MENCDSKPSSSENLSPNWENFENSTTSGLQQPQKTKIKRKSETEQSCNMTGKKQCSKPKADENGQNLNIPSDSITNSHNKVTAPDYSHATELNATAKNENCSRATAADAPQRSPPNRPANPVVAVVACFNGGPAVSVERLDSLESSSSHVATGRTVNRHEDLVGWVSKFQNFNDWEKTQALSVLVKNCNLTQLRHLRWIIEPFFQRDFISQLPRELSLKVLSYLSPDDLLNCAATCRFWRHLSEDVPLWREKCAQRGICPDQLPQPPPPPDSLTTGCAAAPAGQSKTFTRCPWKAVYLRDWRVSENWRRGRPRRQFALRGHDDHVITCLQICGDIVVSGSDDTTLKVWSLRLEQCLHTLAGHTGGVWCSQLTDDGDLVISGSTDRTVKIWDVRTGHCLFTLTGHTSTVRCMALNGDVLISGSRDTTLRAWNIRTGQCLHMLTGHVAAVRCVQFDGRRAVSGAYDYTVKVWDVEKQLCVHTLAGHTNRVYSLQFDSDRNIVVSGSLDTSIRVWDVVSGQCMFTLVGHQSLTSGMQLRDKILVSGNADSTLKVWDITTGRCLYTFSGPQRHLSAVTSLQFLQNGLVATSSDDGTVKLWDTVNGQFICNITRLASGGSGGCIWRLRATPTMLICAVGSRNGTEDTKLLVYDFNANYP